MSTKRMDALAVSDVSRSTRKRGALTNDQERRIHICQQLLLERCRVDAGIPVQDVIHAGEGGEGGLERIHEHQQLVGARGAPALNAKTKDGEQDDGEGKDDLEMAEQTHPAVMARCRRRRPLRDWVIELGNVVLLGAIGEMQRRPGGFPEAFGIQLKIVDDWEVGISLVRNEEMAAAQVRGTAADSGGQLTEDERKLEHAPD